MNENKNSNIVAFRLDPHKKKLLQERSKYDASSDMVHENIRVLTEKKLKEEIANKMLCEVGKKLYYIIRLIKIDNNFFAVEYTYYDKDVVVYLNKEIIEDSIFKYIQNVLNVKIGFSDRIVYCEKLNSYDAKLLNLSRNSPSLVNENLNYLKNGNIFNFSKIIYNYKYTKLLI